MFEMIGLEGLQERERISCWAIETAQQWIAAQLVTLARLGQAKQTVGLHRDFRIYLRHWEIVCYVVYHSYLYLLNCESSWKESINQSNSPEKKKDSLLCTKANANIYLLLSLSVQFFLCNYFFFYYKFVIISTSYPRLYL